MAVQNNLGKVDPLQNDEILEQIFKFLPLEDLLSCRQVCSTWRLESAKVMRLRTKVVLVMGANTSAIEEFLELVQSEKSIFSKKPFASHFMIKSHLLRIIKIPAEFWEVCGRKIKALHISHVKFRNVGDFHDAIFRGCPNMEKLYLERVDVRNGACQEPTNWVPPRFPQNRNLKFLKLSGHYVISWMETMTHFPALEELDVNAYALDDKERGSDKLFRSLILARMHDDQCWKLKSLDVSLDLVDPFELVTFLETGDLPLEKLSISGNYNHQSILQRILNAQAESLKKLSLTINTRVRRNPEPQFVNGLLPLVNVFLEKIEELELFDMSISSMRFLRSVPKLRRLKLRHITTSYEEDYYDEDGWSNQNCTELEVRLISETKVSGLRRLQRRLPNVKTLKASCIGNEELSLICEHWQGLTFLQISESDVSDAGISGLDEKDVKRINRRREDANWRPMTVLRANITALKGLKSFRWESSNKFRLDYCAAVYGIQQLPQLRHLHMDDYPKFDWNRVCNQFPWNQ